MKRRGQIEKESRFRQYQHIIPAVVFISGVAALGMLLWIGWISQKHRTTFLHMDAVMDMQIMASLFHLRLEEGLTDPVKQDWLKTLALLEAASQLSRALIYGGHSEHGMPMPPMVDPRFRDQTESIAARLGRIREIALEFDENSDGGWVGSPMEQEFNTVFDDFLKTARALEVLAEKSLAEEIDHTKRVMFVIILAWVAAVVALSAGIYRVEARRKEAERSLEKAYENTEQQVRSRTSELSLAIRQLQAEIAEHRKTEEQLEASRQELRSLAEHLQSVREEERTWVAREIHDQLGQTLTSLKMGLTWIKRKLTPRDLPANIKLTETIDSMCGEIAGGIGLIREISSELRPGILDSAGLIAAIEWQAEKFSEKSGIQCGLALLSEDFRLDSTRSTALFRIFQEILTNVARHANATKVDIKLAIDSGMLILEIEDNGKGFIDSKVSDSRAFGILGMRERAAAMGGTFHIEGKKGEGTRVAVSIPWSEGRESEEKGYAESRSSG